MNDRLQNLRQKIDKVDDQILTLLKERINLMEKIGDLKKQNNQNIRDDKREKEMMEIITYKADKLKLPHQLIINIWKIIFTQSEEIEK